MGQPKGRAGGGGNGPLEAKRHAGVPLVGPPVSFYSFFFWLGGSTTKIDYSKKATLLTSLEDLTLVVWLGSLDLKPLRDGKTPKKPYLRAPSRVCELWVALAFGFVAFGGTSPALRF